MMLHAEDIHLAFNGTPVLNGIDLELQPGELVGLIGPNGAGKTSLLRVLARLQQPDRGQVLVDRQPLTTVPPKQLAKHMAYLPQGAPAHWPLTVRRVVELGRLPYLGFWEIYSDRDNQAIEQAMQQADVEHLADRTITTLSGGERLRVLIARMFATQANIILADEPIAALDPYHQLHTMELLANHCQQGGSGIVVMHDLNMAARFCHRLLLLDRGTITSEGHAETVLQQHNLSAVYGISAQLIHSETGFTVIPGQRVSKATQHD